MLFQNRSKSEDRKRAYAAVKQAKSQGLLTMQPCVRCGATDDVHMHHPDYAEPLTVVCLCRSCHFTLHHQQQPRQAKFNHGMRPRRTWDQELMLLGRIQKLMQQPDWERWFEIDLEKLEVTVRKLWIALLAGTALAMPAHAAQIISFGQTSTTNTVTATANAAGTSTTIDITGASVLIDQIFGLVTPPAIPAFLTLTATSIDAAVGVGPALLQHYSGSFCITSLAGCGGTNDLSGTFSDAAFGLATGTQLSVNVANPPDTLSLTSSVIPAADLNPPSSFTLALSNVTPGLTLDNATIGSFGASFAGTANAATVIPEPTSLALLGVGLLGLGAVKRWRKQP